uniref:Uncharacterized protein n=1 Tax=Arundo donax TaxID=35708 RepID=A0A0A9EWG7_ARUDO
MGLKGEFDNFKPTAFRSLYSCTAIECNCTTCYSFSINVFQLIRTSVAAFICSFLKE